MRLRSRFRPRNSHTGNVVATTAPGVADDAAQVGPAPQPLPHPVTVTIGTGAAPIVAFATASLADYFGEFTRENLKVNLVSQPATNEIVLLESGRMQMAAMGLVAGVFNALDQGTDLRMVLQGGVQGPTDQDGVWVRNNLLSKNGTFDACQLRHDHYNVAIGPDNNIGILPLALLVQKCPGTTLADVKSHMTLSPLAGADVVAALETGALDLAYLYDPLPSIPGITKYATFEQKTPPDNLDGWMMGPLLKTNPTVATAIMGAMVRTQDTYLQGDYTKNPVVLAALAKMMGEPQAQLRALPPTVFHDRISPAGIVQLQQAYMQYGGLLTFPSPLPPSRLIDPKLLAAVASQS